MNDDLSRESLAEIGYTPVGNPSPGLLSKPRVIFKTKRKNLSHEARIQRLSGKENLLIWQEFSDIFVRTGFALGTEVSAYLHHRGFFPDKAQLYDLPNENVDDYLSDVQLRLLPRVNDYYNRLLYNKLIFWQAFRRFLPLANPLCLIRRQRVYTLMPNSFESLSNLEQHEWLLVKPLEINGVADKLINTRTQVIYNTNGLANSYIHLGQVISNDPGEQLVCSIPLSASGASNICRLFVLRNPKDHLPFIAGAVQLTSAKPKPTIGVVTGAISSRVNLETGRIDSALRVIDGEVIREFDDAQKYLGQEIKNWWNIVVVITSALRRLPVFNALQIDVLISDQGFVITDVSSQVRAEDFQAHGPIMTTDVARDFLREFGI